MCDGKFNWRVKNEFKKGKKTSQQPGANDRKRTIPFRMKDTKKIFHNELIFNRILFSYIKLASLFLRQAIA